MRNLVYSVCEADLRERFEEFGPVAECNLPIDSVTRASKGFGTVTFVMPEHAVSAFNALDGVEFHGRLLHLMKAKSRDTADAAAAELEALSFKAARAKKQKQTAGSAHNWNTLFMGGDQVANAMASAYGTTKEQVLDIAGGGSGAAVRLALGESELMQEMRAFLERNDVQLEAFEAAETARAAGNSQLRPQRSATVIVAKNLPAGTTARELQPLFEKFGPLGRLVLPPSGITALIEFLEPSEARKAFAKLAYSKFKTLPLYLEWAPSNVFRTAATKPLAALPENPFEKTAAEEADRKAKEKAAAKPKVNLFDNSRRAQHAAEELRLAEETAAAEGSLTDDTPPEANTTLFLHNLNFETREPTVWQHFAAIGKIHKVQVALKKDPANPQKAVSMGFGFIQFKRRVAAEKALQTMQFTVIDRKKVELKWAKSTE